MVDYNFIHINANTAQLTQKVGIMLIYCFTFRNFGITHVKVISTPYEKKTLFQPHVPDVPVKFSPKWWYLLVFVH